MSSVSAPTGTATLANTGLYIPVHKRRASNASSSSRSSSSVAHQPRKSPSHTKSPTPTHLISHPTATTPASPSQPIIYTINDLLTISRSPLSQLPPSTREFIRATSPETLTNRKIRKGRDRLERERQRVMAVTYTRRTRPIGRASGTERKRNAAMVLDEAGWRGRVPGTVAMPVSYAMAAAA
jgi:hypothetical protein